MSTVTPEAMVRMMFRELRWPPTVPWHLRRCCRLSFYTGADYRRVPRVRWGREGTYEHLFWRIYRRGDDAAGKEKS